MSWWKVFKSRIAGKVPSVNQLDLDSIGINSAEGKMFIKKRTEAGVESIVLIGGGGGSTGETHEREHQIDSVADHPAVAEGDRNKLVATNATTGAVELIEKPEHNDLPGLNDGDYIHHTATEISEHPYLNLSNVFDGLLNTFINIALSGGTPDKWLKLDNDKKVIFVDLPSIVNTFLGLDDVIPETYVGKDQNVPIVNETEEKLDFIPTEEILTKEVEFIDSTDVPNDYTGHANDLVTVTSLENGLQFSPNPAPDFNGGFSYFGDQNTDGSWRVGVSGTDFLIQVRVSGTWTTKETYTP